MDAGTWLGSIPSWKTREGLGGEGPAGRPNKHRGDPNLGTDLKQIHSAASIERQMDTRNNFVENRRDAFNFK